MASGVSTEENSVVRTQERFASANQAGWNRQEKGGGLGVVLVMAVLAIGVVGVIWLGPTQAVDTVVGLISSQKAAPKEPAEPFVEDTTPVAPVRKPEAHVATPRVAAVRPRRVAAAPPEPHVRTASIRVGMTRQELVQLWGAPDMKATSLESGHVIENYSYFSASKVQQVIVLKDGWVVESASN